MLPEAVIFIGVPAAGKSSFYMQRFLDTHVRINLDMLRTRHREMILLDACLRAQASLVVDNTNVLKIERARYIEPARLAGFLVTGYYFPAALQDALRRNQLRIGRAVVPVKGVISKYRRLEQPEYSEGFDRLFVVRMDETSRQFVVQPWE